METEDEAPCFEEGSTFETSDLFVTAKSHGFPSFSESPIPRFDINAAEADETEHQHEDGQEESDHELCERAPKYRKVAVPRRTEPGPAWGISTFIPLRSDKSPTQPESFRFETELRHCGTRQVLRHKSPFVSRAQWVRQFFRTPRRFHTRAPGSKRSPMAHFTPRHTKPTSPRLATVGGQQQQREEIRTGGEEPRPFRANPVNVRALDGDRIGAAVSAELKAKRRATIAPSKMTTSATVGPKVMLQQPRHWVPTVPQAPALHTEDRALMRSLSVSQSQSTDCQPAGAFVFRAPQQGNEKESSGALARLKRRNQQRTDQRRGPTKAVPFELHTDARATAHMEELSRRVDAEREKEDRARKFVARPAPDTSTMKENMTASFLSRTAASSTLRKTTRPLARIDNFVLNTETRAKAREEFDKHMEQKRAMEAEEEARRAEEQREREAQETRELRKMLVHHPMPILPDSVIRIKPSAKPLTVPQSPMLLSKKRAVRASMTGRCI